MRIAVLADIHGNLIAFEAALADLRSQGVDQVVIAGDIVVGAPDSKACWELAVSLGCPIVRGNHERYVYTYGQPNMPPEWTGQQYLPIAWAHQQTRPDQHTVMAELPMSYSPPGYERELLITHATLRDDHDSIHSRTTEAEFDAMFPVSERRQMPPLIVRGHNHIANTHAWRERTVITIGSCGLPLDHETTVQYAILTRTASAKWTVEHRSIPYDLDAALNRFHHTGYLDATGPIGRLFHRELATASYQILPFLKWFKRWKGERPISLDDAYVRFLNGLA